MSGGFDHRDGELVPADVLRQPRRLDGLVAASAAAPTRAGLVQEDDAVGGHVLERLAEVERCRVGQARGDEQHAKDGDRMEGRRKAHGARHARRLRLEGERDVLRVHVLEAHRHVPHGGRGGLVTVSLFSHVRRFPLRPIVARSSRIRNCNSDAGAKPPEPPARTRTRRHAPPGFVLATRRRCHPCWTAP